MGANRYSDTKPFVYPELRARVAAVLRRGQARRRLGRLRVGPLVVDPTAREATLGGARVALAQKEFALLRTLASEPGRVFTNEELLRDVWGFKGMGAPRTLDWHACGLHQKLAAAGGHFVVTVWGVVYKLI